MTLFLLSWVLAEWPSETIALLALAVPTACGCAALLVMFFADLFGGLR